MLNLRSCPNTPPIFSAHGNPGELLIEFGSGAVDQNARSPGASSPFFLIVPIDISGEFLRASCDLSVTFPDLLIHTIEADFTKPIGLPETVRRLPKLGFPGSTIENLDPPDAVDFLRSMATTLDDGMLLIGIDRRKDPVTSDSSV